MVFFYAFFFSKNVISQKTFIELNTNYVMSKTNYFHDILMIFETLNFEKIHLHIFLYTYALNFYKTLMKFFKNSWHFYGIQTFIEFEK